MMLHSYFLLYLWILSTFVHVLGIFTPKSCRDLQATNGTDGEYVIFLSNNVGFNVYCKGMQQGSSPQEFLTLPAGRNRNFAYFYENIGKGTECSTVYPPLKYEYGGRTEYSRIRIKNLLDLSIQVNDYSFTTSINSSTPRDYATAGDKFSYAPNCPERGLFTMDLKNTPFVIDSKITWRWKGSYPNSTAVGSAKIMKTTYVGCFLDKDDRMLPAQYLSNDHMTIEMCVNHCRGRGFAYAGVQYYLQCFCGDNHNKHGPAPEETCNTPCKGNNQQMCGGVWRISIYGTGLPQTVVGHCGGFPGQCYPDLINNPLAGDVNAPITPILMLQIIPTHPCLQPISPCKNEGKCIAITDSAFKCLCYDNFSGSTCDVVNEKIITMGTTCPAGLFPERCSCAINNCAGAKFEGDTCVTKSGDPKVVCRYSNPGHVILFNVEGSGTVMCPAGSEMVGCSYWDDSGQLVGTGDADSAQYSTGICSMRHGCQQCNLQARCKKYDCGCQHGGHCHMVTGECVCKDGYYGNKCELFDYCSFYEDTNGQSACGAGGLCNAIPENSVKTFGGDNVGDHCQFPFTFKGTSYGSCIETNEVGPPFSCGSIFDGTREGYVDLGMWSPGPVYTMAAWVRPDKADGTRRTILGGVGDCLDYGMYHFENFWVYYKGIDSSCTRGIDTGVRIQTGQWYLVATIHNGSHVISYVNGVQNAVKVKPYVLPTSSGLWIGGEVCCPSNRFKGMIKTVKVWKRSLKISELEASMMTQGNAKTTQEALNGGLVGQWELGEVIQPPCAGIDHGGEDWTVTDGQEINGTHCNITTFIIPQRATVTIVPYNGSPGSGALEIIAERIQIDGILDGIGAGYRGGKSPTAGMMGFQGESYPGKGQRSRSDNRGGGGGGSGGSSRSDGVGEPGGGAGFGTLGMSPVKARGDKSGFGSPGQMYGDGSLKQLFMGSGGGSGGSATDLSKSPPGGRGGNGGGAISLKALRSVTIKGFVSVNGEDGQGDTYMNTQCVGCPAACSVKSLRYCYGDNSTACWDSSGPGGGGSGGSLYLAGKVVSVGENQISAFGGKGGFGTTSGCGGNGGMGRIRVDAAIFKGSVSNLQGVFTQSTLQDEYVDHSQAGQKQINYQTTVYGNEVYRGCFDDPDIHYRTLAYSLPLTDNVRRSMTPEYCMQQCRSRGYAFSGTEYAFECYCDNHLRMDRKKPEGDCQTPCQGDPTKVCGGTNRMTVFGPPPAMPAFAHRGVTQQCQPWCVTADADTSNPKWGQCSTMTQEVTSWKIVCQCPVGFQGLNCKQPCNQGTFGKDCYNNCTCNMTNTQFCDPVTGQCQCKPGFHGNHCNTACPLGYFGVNCEGVCNCTNANSKCDAATGRCICNPGWMGSNCMFPCPSGRWGSNCGQRCLCNNHGDCDPVGGVCKCNPGYKLPFCSETCEIGTYGPDCGFLCNCNNQPCDSMTGMCQCGPGYTGQHCELECPIGFYGQGCHQTCQCTGNYGCDHVTGACHCGPGYIGQRCDVQCPPTSFGVNCAKRCNCFQNQPCDAVTGICLCSAGYRGHQCEQTCPLGYYGDQCKSSCACKNGASCDGRTGQCICPPGWTGSMCEVACQAGLGGFACNTTCPSTCGSGFCSRGTGLCACTTPGAPCVCPVGYYGNQCSSPCDCIHGSCDQSTGSCICKPGWQGTKCSSPCSAGQYGSNCGSQCACVHGRCDPATGTCICDSGYSGTNCNVPCQGRTYGPGCLITCPPCGKYAAAQCDPATGACVCNSGYSGKLCDQPCPAGYYGQNCSSTCSCSNGGLCRSTDGVCLCPDGFTGTQCEIKCSVGFWGTNCSNKCDCGIHGNGCNLATGACNCQAGFIGAGCENSCPSMTYGQNCDQSCQCFPGGTSACSPIDGTCMCKSGYSGQNCFDVCNYGRWGINCSQICQCGSNGNCNPFTGECSCSPGYTGRSCQTMCLQDQYYGQNCSQKCNCNGGHCDPVTGSCQCTPGFKGYHCEQKCGSTHFGINCAQLCGCRNGAICDGVTGDCQCQPGWFGTLCDQKCPDGQFGADCSQSCPDCQNGGICDSALGSCVCLPGFTGSLCNQTCSPGYWGINCQSRCSVSCSRGCQPQTGICNCSPGACLNGGFCAPSGVCICTNTFYGDRCQNSTGRFLFLQSQQGKDYSLTKGQLGGIVAGILLLIIAIVIVVVLVMRKKYTGKLFPEALVTRFSKDGTERLEEEGEGNIGFSNPLSDVRDKDDDNTVRSHDSNVTDA